MRLCGILAALLLAVALVSCGGGGKRASKDGMEMVSTVADTVVMLGADADAPRCSLHIDLQYARGKGAESINRTISGLDAMRLRFAGDSIASNLPMTKRVAACVRQSAATYEAFFRPMYEADKEGARQYDYSLMLSTETEILRSGVLVYKVQSCETSGTDYRHEQTDAYNISLTSGRLLTLDDVYVHGYEPTLLRLIVEKIAHKAGTEADIEALRKEGIFRGVDIYAPRSFIIGRRGLTFVYAPGEIAPHTMGEIRVEVSDGEMEGLLRKDN